MKCTVQIMFFPSLKACNHYLGRSRLHELVRKAAESLWFNKKYGHPIPLLCHHPLPLCTFQLPILRLQWGICPSSKMTVWPENQPLSLNLSALFIWVIYWIYESSPTEMELWPTSYISQVSLVPFAELLLLGWGKHRAQLDSSAPSSVSSSGIDSPVSRCVVWFFFF